MELAPLGFPIGMVIALAVIVFASVAMDLWSHRNSTEISLKDAAGWSVFWIALAIGWYFYIKVVYGAEYASMFMSGYALEKTLSVDNLMVFIAIFSSFGIRSGILQHRILYWGIIGALVFRGIFVAAGTALFAVGSWVELLFAALVIYSAYLMFKGGDDDEEVDYTQHPAVRFVQKFIPVVPQLHKNDLLVCNNTVEEMKKENPSLSVVKKAAYYATPAFLCLVCIELSDIMFSFDSVPAIIAVTQEPILVYSAVIFAILGLRNLYFMLAVATKYLCHLEKWVGVVLVFIGIKLGMAGASKVFGLDLPHIDHTTSLYVVLACIAAGIIHSIVSPEDDEDDQEEANA
ncbi:TerC/Alx family metal homeostasis membrane protein [Vibrio owensii]|uniref:TerC/Alx family metal homeostasis membrane protein n=1 Tax=Vibrio harveyi group TaxID=717610 RepID=UPI003CC63E4B